MLAAMTCEKPSRDKRINNQNVRNRNSLPHKENTAIIKT